MDSISKTFVCPTFDSRVVPVIVISHPQQAVPLAHALLEGGIDVMEITLRHEAGLRAIEEVAKHVPHMQVGAGTVTHPAEMARVQSAGARFALSPGLNDTLVQAALDCSLPYMPGVLTPSEVMAARNHGFRLVKLFPASMGGLDLLQALAGPLGDMRFCPTGGVNLNNLVDFLKRPNVSMVGGSWITPLDAIEQGRWTDITDWARTATQAAQKVPLPKPSSSVAASR